MKPYSKIVTNSAIKLRQILEWSLPENKNLFFLEDWGVNVCYPEDAFSHIIESEKLSCKIEFIKKTEIEVVKQFDASRLQMDQGLHYLSNRVYVQMKKNLQQKTWYSLTVADIIEEFKENDFANNLFLSSGLVLTVLNALGVIGAMWRDHAGNRINVESSIAECNQKVDNLILLCRAFQSQYIHAKYNCVNNLGINRHVAIDSCIIFLQTQYVYFIEMDDVERSYYRESFQEDHYYIFRMNMDTQSNVDYTFPSAITEVMSRESINNYESDLLKQKTERGAYDKKTSRWLIVVKDNERNYKNIDRTIICDNIAKEVIKRSIEDSSDLRKEQDSKKAKISKKLADLESKVNSTLDDLYSASIQKEEYEKSAFRLKNPVVEDKNYYEQAQKLKDLKVDEELEGGEKTPIYFQGMEDSSTDSEEMEFLMQEQVDEIKKCLGTDENFSAADLAINLNIDPRDYKMDIPGDIISEGQKNWSKVASTHIPNQGSIARYNIETKQDPFKNTAVEKPYSNMMEGILNVSKNQAKLSSDDSKLVVYDEVTALLNEKSDKFHFQRNKDGSVTKVLVTKNNEKEDNPIKSINRQEQIEDYYNAQREDILKSKNEYQTMLEIVKDELESHNRSIETNRVPKPPKVSNDELKKIQELQRTGSVESAIYAELRAISLEVNKKWTDKSKRLECLKRACILKNKCNTTKEYNLCEEVIRGCSQ